MKNKKLRVFNYLIPALVLLVTGLLYKHMPDMIPLTWSMDGTVSYGGKMQIWGITGLGAGLAVLFDVMPHIDPRRHNYEKFGKYYDGFCIVMQIFMAVTTSVVMSETFYPGRISVSRVMSVMVGLLLIAVGNFLPKLKSNFYMGIKTPWTISNDEVWRKTHRLGGKCMFAAGLVMVVSTLFLPEKAAFTLGMSAVMLAAIVPGVMSYVWWKQLF